MLWGNAMRWGTAGSAAACLKVADIDCLARWQGGRRRSGRAQGGEWGLWHEQGSGVVERKQEQIYGTASIGPGGGAIRFVHLRKSLGSGQVLDTAWAGSGTPLTILLLELKRSGLVVPSVTEAVAQPEWLTRCTCGENRVG